MLITQNPLQIDLSSWLPKPTWEEEAKLWEEMIQHKILFTPGASVLRTHQFFSRGQEAQKVFIMQDTSEVFAVCQCQKGLLYRYL